MKQYMIEIELPQTLTEEFVRLIPQQRAKINELMGRVEIFTYSLSADRSRLWVIAKANSEKAVMDLLAKFPLIDHMRPEITELAFYMSEPVGMPKLIFN